MLYKRAKRVEGNSPVCEGDRSCDALAATFDCECSVLFGNKVLLCVFIIFSTTAVAVHCN